MINGPIIESGASPGRITTSGSGPSPPDEVVSDRTDGDHDRDGHAPFAGRAVGGGNCGIGSYTDVCVGQDDHMVLGSPEGLHPLPVAGTRVVHVAGHRRASHEGHGIDSWVGEQGIDCFGITLDHAENPVREPRLLDELRKQQRG